jgi:hypothetical protein
MQPLWLDVRRSARVSPRTDSVTGGYRRLTHLRLVTAHAHDVHLVPLWLTDCVCSCPVGRLRDYLQEGDASLAAKALGIYLSSWVIKGEVDQTRRPPRLAPRSRPEQRVGAAPLDRE